MPTLDLDAHDNEAERARRTAWLSQGLEALIAALGARRDERASSTHPDDRLDFDVVIVGSGYGGAVALSELAGCTREDGTPLRIAMLERGQEYLPGMFPSGFAELAGHVRFSTAGAAMPAGKPLGVFDVRAGPDVQSLVANGVGGGSLINAGVMAMPHPRVFADARWPKAIREDVGSVLDLERSLLDALDTRAHGGTRKGAAMARLAGNHAFSEAQVQVAKPASNDGATSGPASRRNAQGVRMHACLHCGDCFSGCNFGAKSSLDLTLLVPPCRQQGAGLYTGATVLRVEAYPDAGWCLDVVHTDPRRREREVAPLELTARRVILAAGAFGSTEILLRSARSTKHSPGLTFSPRLGERFSGNGDSMTAIYGMRDEAHALSREEVAPDKRRIGPTITSIIDLRGRDGAGVDGEEPLVIEEMAIPAAMRPAFEQIVLTADALQRLGKSDGNDYRRDRYPRDPNAVDDDTMDRSLLVAVIGHDSADGRLVLSDPPAGQGDGTVSVVWPELRFDPALARREQRLAKLATARGGVALTNPMWRALPEDLSRMLGAPLGPTLTVHPLGGCVMGDDASTGVVDHCGRVFRDQHHLHDGLVVLDGSIVPTSLGINPALGISALALRAVRLLREEWKLRQRQAPVVDQDRPVLRKPEHVIPRRTRVVVAERLLGAVALADGRTVDVELELRSRPQVLRRLMSAKAPGVLRIDPAHSSLIVRSRPGKDGAAPRVIGQARVRGTLTAMNHLPTTPLRRVLRALPAWFVNRGLRDVLQSALRPSRPAEVAALRMPPRSLAGKVYDMGRQLWSLVQLASRSGDGRLLEYDLALHEPVGTSPPFTDEAPAITGAMKGVKTITYGRAANPWAQLMEVELESFPGATSARPGRLTVDMRYFRKKDTLLLSIVDQQDAPTAIADFGAYGSYLMRTLLHLHLWTFRLPDPSPDHEQTRLPGAIPGLRESATTCLPVGSTPDGKPAHALLTRYRGTGADPTPVVLIHGYSASGTTFAHPAIPEGGLAAHLCRQGRDAWVLDLRSSCGMCTARAPWTWEQVGYGDIPRAIDHVLRETGQDKVDIVAHCMGGAMLCMALLGEYPAAADDSDPDLALRRLLPDRIRKLVLSQVGPAVLMTPANVMRAQAMRYLQHFLPLDAYEFRPTGPRDAAAAAMDRVLASVPYAADEFALENPFWPPRLDLSWVATRHRVDALFGVTFKLANMPAAVLDRLDDFFGPLNVRTAAQVIHFTAAGNLTNSRGRAAYSNMDIARARLKFPVLSLHGVENGLADHASQPLMDEYLKELGVGEALSLEGFGHQDTLIGTRSPEVFARIASFLSR